MSNDLDPAAARLAEGQAELRRCDYERTTSTRIRAADQAESDRLTAQRHALQAELDQLRASLPKAKP